jgi:hypothetical protein
MTAMHAAAWLPDLEDAPRRAWPDHATRTANVNDNQAADVYAADIDWDTLIQPQPLLEQAPQIDTTPTPQHFHGENALYGVAGAASLFVALTCLIAH